MANPALYKQIRHHVVVVTTGDSQGSGVLLSPTIVATNCHVVEHATRIGVAFFSEKTSASIVGRNDPNDVCILRLSTVLKGSTPVRQVRRFEGIEIGEPIYALGAPLGMEYTMTSGIVSQLRRKDGGLLIQFDAAISSGNSGGGLFDKSGALLGLPSFTASINHLPSSISQNMNFAWSVEVFPDPARALVTQLSGSPMVSDAPTYGKSPQPETKPATSSPVAGGVQNEKYGAKWQALFESSEHQNAYALAIEWVRAESINPYAFIAKGRSREVVQGNGSGLTDFLTALRLAHNHPHALYWAALSSKSTGDIAGFQKYRDALRSVNPILYERLR